MLDVPALAAVALTEKESPASNGPSSAATC
jgi:hypothetical protein